MTQSLYLRNGRPVALRAAASSDLESIRRLLSELALPAAGLEEWWPHFTVAESDEAIVGLAGMERYGDGILLRSVAVHPSWRSSGLGRALVDTVLRHARREGSQDAYLLTTTAEQYFPRLGFSVIPRSAVPTSVQSSMEFREACPASAVVMHRTLAQL
jgi:amino-acid N-acetyltransferase